jgi:hypothetical protein
MRYYSDAHPGVMQWLYFLSRVMDRGWDDRVIIQVGK